MLIIFRDLRSYILNYNRALSKHLIIFCNYKNNESKKRAGLGNNCPLDNYSDGNSPCINPDSFSCRILGFCPRVHKIIMEIWKMKAKESLNRISIKKLYVHLTAADYSDFILTIFSKLNSSERL